MSVKILAIGDPHFKVDNILEVELFVEKLETLAKETRPDYIICLGDLLHTHERLHVTPLNKAYDFVDRLRKIAKTYIIVGNHDYIQNQQFLTENHWMNGMKEWFNVVIVDKVLAFSASNFNFLLCPYVPNGRFEEALNTFGQDWKKWPHCIFAHQEFFGCKMGAIISVEGDKWDESYPKVVSGHIHSKQTPQSNIYYTGSAMQHAFGESETNTIPIFTFTNGSEYLLDEVDLKTPRKKIIYMDIDDIDSFVPKETKDDIKITLSGNYDEFKAFKKSEKYKELSKNGTKVVFKVKKTDTVQIHTSKCESDSDFVSILRDLVLQTEDTNVMEFFELIVNNNDVMLIQT